MLEKPPIGDPCNGCGLCCRAQICAAGSFTMGLVDRYGERADGPCPALVEQEGGGFACGMVLRPRDYALGRAGAHDLREAVKMMIGAGAGCDEGEDDEALRRVQVRFLEVNGPMRIERAVALWFGVNGDER